MGKRFVTHPAHTPVIAPGSYSAVYDEEGFLFTVAKCAVCSGEIRKYAEDMIFAHYWRDKDE